MVAPNRSKLIAVAAIGAIVSLPLQSLGQNPFPDGAARDTVVLVCSQCHPLTRLIDSDKSAAEWEFILYDMIARGAPVHAEHLEQVREYLIDHFAVDGR